MSEESKPLVRSNVFPDAASQSARLFERAARVMPGANTRHTVLFPPYPIYAVSAEGTRVTDADGVDRIDFVNNYSSLIHGHRHVGVMRAVERQLKQLTAVGLPTESEIELAELLCARLPCVELLRFLNSGTEAVMLAIKTARAFTNRPKIAKIEGAYHGLYDAAEISQAPSADAWGPEHEPISVPLSPGTPKTIAEDVVVLPFNDVSAAEHILTKHGSSIAAVLVDVMPAHLAYLQASSEFLNMLSRYTQRSGALLILDEVYSLRLAFGGAQTLFGLQPDLVALGKIMGGGFPIGALGGSRRVMSMFEPGGARAFMPHGGTYNANPISMVAGTAAMQAYDEKAVLRLNGLGNLARSTLREAIKQAGISAQIKGDGSLFAVRFTDRPLRSYRDLVPTSMELAYMQRFHRCLLNNGILASPQGLFILSTAMSEADIALLGRVSLQAFRELASLSLIENDAPEKHYVHLD